MTVLSFGPDTSEYEIYQGCLGAAWFVRLADRFWTSDIIGVGRDRKHAVAIMRSHKAERDRMQRRNPVFLFAA